MINMVYRERFDEDSKLEAEIATAKAWLQCSSFNRQQKEPYDTPDAMTPVAYAMMELLVDAGGGSGRFDEWQQFLRDCLNECIAIKYLDNP